MYGGGQKHSQKNLIKSIRNLNLEKENEAIKDKTIRDIRTLFKQEDDCCKPIGIDKFWNNSYIEYESSGDRNKTLLGRYNN